jgi:hypothetical protein
MRSEQLIGPRIAFMRLRDEVSDATAVPAQPTPEVARPDLLSQVTRLQHTMGNRAVARMVTRGMLARQPAVAPPSPAPSPSPVPSTADWLQVVPDAQDTVVSEYDTATKAQKIVHKAKPGGATAGTQPDAATQASIDAACAAVASYRATLPEPVVTSGITSSQGAKWTGTSWTRYSGLGRGGSLRPPTPTKKNPKPEDKRTEAQKQAYASQTSYIDWMAAEGKTIGTKELPKAGEDLAAYKAWLGDRLYFDIGSMEGGFDSINVYDSQIVTWGAGLGGASGYVADALRSMAESTLAGGGKVVGEEVTKILHSAGIALEDVPGAKGRSRFVVLDPASKRTYRGDSALHLIKADNRLLMLFTNLARGELPGLDVDTVPAADPGQPAPTSLKQAARRAAFEGQRHVFLETYAGSGLKGAVDQLGPTWPYESLMMVLHMHWWGLAGWHAFKDTAGDMKAIIKKCYTFGKYVTTRNGANVAVRDLGDHLYSFGGASSRGSWGAEQQLSEDQLESGAYYIETAREVEAAEAVPDTIKDGKVVKRGKAAVAHQDPKYRKLL